MGGRHLDMIADDLVVLDLQRGDTAFGGIARLHLGDQPPPVVAHGALLVQFGRIARRNEIAVPREQGYLGLQGLRQPLYQRIQRDEGIPGHLQGCG